MDNGYDSPTGIPRLEISDENMIPTNSGLIHVESNLYNYILSVLGGVGSQGLTMIGGLAKHELPGYYVVAIMISMQLYLIFLLVKCTNCHEKSTTFLKQNHLNLPLFSLKVCMNLHSQLLLVLSQLAMQLLGHV